MPTPGGRAGAKPSSIPRRRIAAQPVVVREENRTTARSASPPVLTPDSSPVTTRWQNAFKIRPPTIVARPTSLAPIASSPSRDSVVSPPTASQIPRAIKRSYTHPHESPQHKVQTGQAYHGTNVSGGVPDTRLAKGVHSKHHKTSPRPGLEISPSLPTPQRPSGIPRPKAFSVKGFGQVSQPSGFAPTKMDATCGPSAVVPTWPSASNTSTPTTPEPPRRPSPTSGRSAAIRTTGVIKDTQDDCDALIPHSAFELSPPRITPIPQSDRGGYFSGAHDFNISRLNISHNQGTTSRKSVFDHLGPYIAHGAAHDSSERRDAPACHEGTYVAVRQHIVSWIKHGEGDDEPKRIMWLSGPAGCGKTAIAGSVAEECKKEGLLAATFMFSSFSVSADRQSKRCVVTTLASHLAEHELLHEFKAQLLLSVERNPSIFRKRLKEQAECLILAPLRLLQEQCNITTWPKGIVLDGLDEVEAQQYHDPTRQGTNREHEDDQLEILDALFTLATDPTFPFRIFVSSRPERVIQAFFSSVARQSTLQLFLDSKYNPDADIELFLKSKFAETRRRYSISDASWPSQSVLARLVDMSSGQFIVPATIMRWIGAGLPQQQVDEVLQLRPEAGVSRGPFASLYTLYGHILNACIRDASRFFAEPPPLAFWLRFFEHKDGDFHQLMARVTSLISVSQDGNMTIHHQMLNGFLSNENRCGDLYVNDTALDRFLEGRIVKVLKSGGCSADLSLPIPDTLDFLERFLELGLSTQLSDITPDSPIRNWGPSFFGFLRETSADALALCNVALWAHILLVRIPIGADGFNHAKLLLGSMYCGIHKVVKCNSSVFSVPDAKCKTACIRWRTGILDEARKRNWCVHEIVMLDVDQLETVSIEGFDRMFRKRSRDTRCDICDQSIPI